MTEDASIQDAETVISQPSNLLETNHCSKSYRLFILLCLLHASVFLDRGAVATNEINGHRGREGVEGRGFKGEFDLTNFEDGVIVSSMMFGCAIGSLVFVRFSFKTSRLIPIACGMLLWALGATACGLCIDFYSLIVARFIMGLGQSPLTTLGTVIVDDIAPEKSIATWLAIFQLMTSIGLASGFVYGSLFGDALHWRWAFFIEALIVLPIVAYCFHHKRFQVREGPRKSGIAFAGTGGSIRMDGDCTADGDSWLENVKILLSHTMYDLIAVATAFKIGALTAASYWTTRMMGAVFGVEGVDLTVGVLFLTASICGGIVGGKIADSCFESTTWNMLKITTVAMTCSVMIGVPMALFVRNYAVFVILLGVSTAIALMPSGPISASSLWAVPPELRPLSRGLLAVGIPVFGSIPIPAFYGAVVDLAERGFHTGNAHRVAYASTLGFFLISVMLFGIAMAISPQHPDYRGSSPS